MVVRSLSKNTKCQIPRRWYLTIWWCDTACHAHTNTHTFKRTHPPLLPDLANETYASYCLPCLLTVLHWERDGVESTQLQTNNSSNSVCVCVCMRASGRTCMYRDTKPLHENKGIQHICLKAVRAVCVFSVYICISVKVSEGKWFQHWFQWLHLMIEKIHTVFYVKIKDILIAKVSGKQWANSDFF